MGLAVGVADAEAVVTPAPQARVLPRFPNLTHAPPPWGLCRRRTDSPAQFAGGSGRREPQEEVPTGHPSQPANFTYPRSPDQTQFEISAGPFWPNPRWRFRPASRGRAHGLPVCSSIHRPVASRTESMAPRLTKPTRFRSSSQRQPGGLRKGVDRGVGVPRPLMARRLGGETSHGRRRVHVSLVRSNLPQDINGDPVGRIQGLRVTSG